jgi:hypothetical protein
MVFFKPTSSGLINFIRREIQFVDAMSACINRASWAADTY